MQPSGAKGGEHMKKPCQKEAEHRARRLLEALQLGEPSPADPQGSYTGIPEQDTRPVQDADDL